ncbi:hypothetical protein ACTVH1_03500 [Gluconobacter cerinus]
MKFIHAVIRKLRPRARHPDEVRSELIEKRAAGIMSGYEVHSALSTKRVFGLADPVQDERDLKVRPTLAEVEAFQALPPEQQLEALNTYLRMVEEFAIWGHPANERFVLTLRSGKLRFMKSGGVA